MARMDRKEYEEQLRHLQAELCWLQEWVKTRGLRVAIVFEGRDSAGKGGAIAAIRQRVSPRVFRTVALPSPSDREKSQWYFQRYIEHLPAAGEVTLFDRSWYNRAGVERVMGFATEKQVKDFLKEAPKFEKTLVDDGIILLKYWLVVSDKEQQSRFQERIDEPAKHWKLSPMDLESRKRWYEYARARDAMFQATDTKWAPWHLVDFNDQRRGRLNLIHHFLAQIPYKKAKREKVVLPKRNRKGAYDDLAPLKDRKWVAAKF